ncbi:MAG TPA: TrkH family potassium uptake protein [Pseudomonadales bacterium]
MINVRKTSRLLAMPVLWMGAVQAVFGVLSFTFFHDQVTRAFLLPAAGMMLAAALIYLMTKKIELGGVSFRDALAFATLTWVITGLLGALPIINVTHVRFVDGVFESISALTTTGATVLTGLDHMPPSFLMYRQFLQWMGGLGVVIFVVAVLPMLNIGGMRLLKAETPGPMKDDRLSPRIANTAHYLWLVYISLTVLCALCYYWAGMSAFDAIGHSFTTLSTGGFSTHDASMGYFNSHRILAISNLFMMAGAISFALHFRVFSRLGRWRVRWWLYWRDEETRTFVVIVLVLAMIFTGYLFANRHYDSLAVTFSYALFHVISFITSTGFGAADFASWPPAACFLLVIAGYLGGCSGSTAGGNKIVRNIITLKSIRNQLRQLIHPYGVFSLRYQGGRVDYDVRSSVMSFMTLSAATSTAITVLLVATGLDFWSAFSAAAACLNVLGPGFGVVGSNFAPVSDTGTWILSAAMILGRLEYFTVLALLLPAFWRR